MNEYSECCNYPKLFKHIDGGYEEWDFCGNCLDCCEYYEADEPREEDEQYNSNYLSDLTSRMAIQITINRLGSIDNGLQ